MSIKQLNNWIRSEYPDVNIELYKGEGYFYWIDADRDADSDVYNRIGFEFESIYVCHFSHAPLSWWKAQAKSQIDAYLNARAAANAGTTPEAAAGDFPIADGTSHRAATQVNNFEVALHLFAKGCEADALSHMDIEMAYHTVRSLKGLSSTRTAMKEERADEILDLLFRMAGAAEVREKNQKSA